MVAGLELAAAEATYWSSMPLGVSDLDVAEAWAAAARDAWRDEVHVEREQALTRAAFVFNSGHVRTTVCECALLVAPVWRTTHFLTAVVTTSFGLNLGWALHTRTLDALTGGSWPNPHFGEAAVRSWSAREELRRRAQPPRVSTTAVFVDRVMRFALEVDTGSDRTFVSIPVQNAAVEYLEYYEVDRATFDRFRADPALAHGFVEQARNRELDHLLLFPPGADRGLP